MEPLHDLFTTQQLMLETKWLNALVKQYKKQTPIVTPKWDTSTTSTKQNDICETIIASGLILYVAPFEDVWSGIFDPAVYDKDTLWKKSHDNRKIARVINHWQNNRALSPIFLVKHGSKSLGLVADGKHRLTVARYMCSESMPFMVPVCSCQWVSVAIPTATKL